MKHTVKVYRNGKLVALRDFLSQNDTLAFVSRIKKNEPQSRIEIEWNVSKQEVL